MVPTSIGPGFLKNERKWGPVMIPDMTLRTHELSTRMHVYARGGPAYPWSYPNWGRARRQRKSTGNGIGLDLRGTRLGWRIWRWRRGVAGPRVCGDGWALERDPWCICRKVSAEEKENWKAGQCGVVDQLGFEDSVQESKRGRENATMASRRSK